MDLPSGPLVPFCPNFVHQQTSMNQQWFPDASWPECLLPCFALIINSLQINKHGWITSFWSDWVDLLSAGLGHQAIVMECMESSPILGAAQWGMLHGLSPASGSDETEDYMQLNHCLTKCPSKVIKPEQTSDGLKALT